MADEPSAREQYQQLLTQQVAMNKQIYAQLVRAGLQSHDHVRLDFLYYGPNQQAVEALSELLRKETDYELNVTTDADGWMLSGKTQETPITQAMLDQWVDWMITAGLQHECAFDGWGTGVP
jgi:hypothetical protein